MIDQKPNPNRPQTPEHIVEVLLIEFERQARNILYADHDANGNNYDFDVQKKKDLLTLCNNLATFIGKINKADTHGETIADCYNTYYSCQKAQDQCMQDLSACISRNCV